MSEQQAKYLTQEEFSNHIEAKHRASDYREFVEQATALFVTKSTDYEDAFIQGMIDHDHVPLWKWEVEKKLNRLRTWLKRGELQVKDEGLRNSVDDIFIYTVQFYAYNLLVFEYDDTSAKDFLNLLRQDRKRLFRDYSAAFGPRELVDYLKKHRLIHEDELLLQGVIRIFMGDEVVAEEWRQAIRIMLKGADE